MIDFNTPFSHLHPLWHGPKSLWFRSESCPLWHGRLACAMEAVKKRAIALNTKSAIAPFNS
ncbi:hypothetical protein [Phormidium nigroviride]|uniref:hypothetical protein n=1 Tax=Phormidium nigroviride TaxID=482564 RepID=UPI00167FC566|nr:hypothetical protein [Oscillatoria nigro-viridis]